MRLGLVGASGATGTWVMDVALEAGHTVRALTRRERSERFGVDWIEGDVLDPSSVARMATGTEAVIVALGLRADSPIDLCSRGTATVIAACRAFRIERLIVLTSAIVGHSLEKQSVMLRTIRTTYRLVQRAEAEDRDLQEAMVRESGLRYTLVRPPRMSDGGPTLDRKVGSELFLNTADRATRGDVAAAMVDAAVEGKWEQLGVTVVSG